MKKTLFWLWALSFSIALPAKAHDFWLVPSDYRLETAGDVDIGFVIGHDDEITPWTLRWDRVVALRAYGPSGVKSLQASLIPSADKAPGSAKAALGEDGTHILALESYHSSIELDAKAFNRYAQKEGLAEVLAQREAGGTTKKPGTEIYARRAKAIVQVGDTLSETALQPIGHTLEIVPEVHPVGLKAGDDLPVRVFFRGKPLKGALIDIADLNKGTDAKGGEITDEDGRAVFKVTASSIWKVNVVWSWPNPGNSRADYETIFTSLVFSNQ